MEFKQFYLDCLAHASYLVGDDGVCAIVDPQRDVDGYLAEAERRGLEIRHVIETHLHADFVSGHVELARRTGATIHISQRAQAKFESHPVQEGDEIVMGSVVLRFIETPGHTPESLCVLVIDKSVSPEPGRILTGDTLFIGDVGRPDLAGSKGFTPKDMAGMMYDTLRTKIMPLPDAVEVFPAHGAGSACGRNISSALSSTIGEQKATNHALAEMTREEFVDVMTTGLAAPPRYFPFDAELNRQGAVPLDELPRPPALEPDEVTERIGEGALVLDVRRNVEFGAGHVPGSVNVGLGGKFASWCGALLPTEAALVLVTADEASVDEAVMRLARVGMQGVVGSLAGGIDAWRAASKPVATVEQVTVEELDAARAGLFVLDVRGPGEHEDKAVPEAVNVPLPELEERVGELDPERPMAVICAGGYRSSTATSLLQRHGFSDLRNVLGGTNAWVEAGLPTTPDVAGTAAG